ncbi:MAG: deoxyguanosinetriphosphate triphosphohydrolase [Acidobacteria bacterium]|nr:deoxyguanosinetriphosphate triphosphohydrolase [Acidobacteriota bacterium]
MLATLRFPVARSLGRRYPEPDHPYRNAFQRDRDRVVHARAFRRLEAKTQVFTPGLSDHFRTRLTHTIEVSQIARTAASCLQLDEDLTEALALAHDIGHPPFAHAGESELDRQMRRFGDRFDHNLHALRIVETFEQRYARFPGLNLTFEVREGMAKHSRDFQPGEIPALDEYLPGLRPPLEAQLIDLADEIAYNTADLDDAYSAGLLSAAQVAGAVPQYAAILEAVETQFPGASSREQFQEALRRLIDLLVSGLIEGTARAASESGAGSVEEVRAHAARIATFTETAQETNRQLKQFLHSHVYSSPALVEERRRASAAIAGLFQIFVEHPEQMPENYRAETEHRPPHRVVCDYIAGMTDAYFQRTYAAVAQRSQTL